jgi:Protein of unknown function (DUF1573)
MHRYGFVLLAGLMAAGPAAAASWADGLFDELNKDFGSVPRGPTLVHPFRVVNKTNGPVSIVSVRVSCGCTSATALRSYLNPGEETAVVARMDTTRFTGVKSVTIYVQFDRPAFEEVRLWVQANARNDFAVSPDSLAFGQVRRGSAPAAAVNVTFYGNSDAQIVDVRSESNYIRPQVREVRRQDSEVTYQLSAALRPDAPVGKWYTDVWVRTNNPAIPQVRVPLTVEIESALSVTPEAVSLGQVRVKGESERRVIVRGTKPFKITRVQGADSQVTVKDNTPESRAVHVLTVRLKAAEAGELSRILRVLTDLPEDNMIDFQVSALVMP